MLDPTILKHFKCSGCGACCRWGGSVLLTDEDIRKLADFLGLTEPEFIEQHTRLAPNRKQLALLDQTDGSCAWLQGDRCAVYAVRPVQCSSFPYAWSVPQGCPELDRLLAHQKSVEQPGVNP
ncbi:YkgJ family cysteine cluster protein [Pontiella sp.]|uniref:YkgJ family cysteine cluster protein n=1 Tax=Pontiella sp. TaxID=2837462 RepID=UPI003568F7D0